MKKHYSLFACLAISAVALLFIGPRAHAGDDGPFNAQIQLVHFQRSMVENQLAISQQFDIYPHATSYYDDLEDHYEHDQLMRDVLEEGIR